MRKPIYKESSYGLNPQIDANTDKQTRGNKLPHLGLLPLVLCASPQCFVDGIRTQSRSNTHAAASTPLSRVVSGYFCLPLISDPQTTCSSHLLQTPTFCLG